MKFLLNAWRHQRALDTYSCTKIGRLLILFLKRPPWFPLGARCKICFPILYWMPWNALCRPNMSCRQTMRPIKLFSGDLTRPRVNSAGGGKCASTDGSCVSLFALNVHHVVPNPQRIEACAPDRDPVSTARLLGRIDIIMCDARQPEEQHAVQ